MIENDMLKPARPFWLATHQLLEIFPALGDAMNLQSSDATESQFAAYVEGLVEVVDHQDAGAGTLRKSLREAED